MVDDSKSISLAFSPLSFISAAVWKGCFALVVGFVLFELSLVNVLTATTVYLEHPDSADLVIPPLSNIIPSRCEMNFRFFNQRRCMDVVEHQFAHCLGLELGSQWLIILDEVLGAAV